MILLQKGGGWKGSTLSDSWHHAGTYIHKQETTMTIMVMPTAVLMINVLIFHQGLGLICSEGNHWREQRRWIGQALRWLFSNCHQLVSFKIANGKIFILDL